MAFLLKRLVSVGSFHIANKFEKYAHVHFSELEQVHKAQQNARL